MAHGWQLDADSLVCGPVRLALQRLGAAYWRPQGVLRSWGLVPLHHDGQRVCVPCGDAEALWIGAWLEPAQTGAQVALAMAPGGPWSTIALPQAYAITALAGGRPLTLAPGQAALDCMLRVRGQDGGETLVDMRLMAPPAWCALSGRPWQALPAQPPPPPPRLG